MRALIKFNNNRKNSGFTLVELAIVLVVIGLLVGGVLQGQELIKQAKIRKILFKINEVNTASNTFLSKYNALPGDIKNATSYWGDRGNCTTVYPGGVDLMAETVTETCDGDGDGWVSENSSNVQENDYFWQQLKNAELFYSAKSIAWEPGAYRVATPVSDIYLGVGAVLAYNPNPKYNFIVLGGTWEDTVEPLANIISPELAQSLDYKLDDGMPNSGIMKILNISSTDCLDGSSPEQYDLADSSNKCSLLLKSSF